MRENDTSNTPIDDRELLRVWRAVKGRQRPFIDAEAVIARLESYTSADVVGTPGARVPEARGRRPWAFGALISAATIIVIAYTWGGGWSSRTAPTKSGHTQTYTTRSGQRATVTLADGSQAVLAPATTLRVDGRNVYLTGAALFTITQRNSAPFTVTTGNSVTRVLGTTFSVRHYVSDKVTQVVVAEGKVASNDATLTTGDVATVVSGEMPVINHGQDISALLGWTTGQLRFRNIALGDVLAELERWYGLKFEAGPELLKERVTVDLPANDLGRTITYLGDVLNAQTARNGNIINFTRSNR